MRNGQVHTLNHSHTNAHNSHLIMIIYRNFEKWQQNNLTITTQPFATIKYNEAFNSNIWKVDKSTVLEKRDQKVERRNGTWNSRCAHLWIEMKDSEKSQQRKRAAQMLCSKHQSNVANKETQLKNIHTYKCSIHY